MHIFVKKPDGTIYEVSAQVLQAQLARGEVAPNWPALPPGGIKWSTVQAVLHDLQFHGGSGPTDTTRSVAKLLFDHRGWWLSLVMAAVVVSVLLPADSGSALPVSRIITRAVVALLISLSFSGLLWLTTWVFGSRLNAVQFMSAVTVALGLVLVSSNLPLAYKADSKRVSSKGVQTFPQSRAVDLRTITVFDTSLFHSKDVASGGNYVQVEKVLGRLRNGSLQTLKQCFLTISVFDSSTNLIDTAVVVIRLGALAPGAVKFFEQPLYVSRVPQDFYWSYSVTAAEFY